MPLSPIISRLAVTLAVLACSCACRAGESSLWKEFLSDVAGGKSSLLPDFSYAGYSHGEKGIPEIKAPVFKVTDYGAVPDGSSNSAPAIQRAIDACEASGGGVVFFPKGLFLINNDEKSSTPALRISAGKVVLRGAGSGADGTVLWSPACLQPEDPLKMWTGQAPVVIGTAPVKPVKTARVAGPSARGSMTLTLQEGESFAPGDRLILGMHRKGNTAASFVSPHAWETNWTTGITIREIHAVSSVQGRTLHLAEPLMIDVDDTGDWTVEEASFLREIGVENLRFRGGWKEHFLHHRSWRDDSAWRGLDMRGCENSWIRNCVFEDMNWPLSIARSRQITVEDLRFTGTPGHFGMMVSGSYGVLALRVYDNAGHHHGPSVQGGACSTVFRHCSWAADTSFDSHAKNPYATLHDENVGGMNLGGVGGHPTDFPHHLHAFVLWNPEVLGKPDRPVDFWTVGSDHYPRSFPQVVIAGTHGVSVTFAETSVARNESPGSEVEPRSLWMAQLERRLGSLPEWLRGSCN